MNFGLWQFRSDFLGLYLLWKVYLICVNVSQLPDSAVRNIFIHNYRSFKLTSNSLSQLLWGSFGGWEQVGNLLICEAPWAKEELGFSLAPPWTNSLYNWASLSLSLSSSVTIFFHLHKGELNQVTPNDLSTSGILMGLQVPLGEEPCLFYSLCFPES